MTTGTQFADWQAGGGGGGLITAVTLPLIAPGGNLQLPQSNATTDGYLSAVDWNRFNAAALGGYLFQEFTLNGADITNKFVTLPSIPTAPALSVLTNLQGLQQEYGVDYTIVGNQLRWNGLGLDGFFVSGNKFTVQYY